MWSFRGNDSCDLTALLLGLVFNALFVFLLFNMQWQKTRNSKQRPLHFGLCFDCSSPCNPWAASRTQSTCIPIRWRRGKCLHYFHIAGIFLHCSSHSWYGGSVYQQRFWTLAYRITGLLDHCHLQCSSVADLVFCNLRIGFLASSLFSNVISTGCHKDRDNSDGALGDLLHMPWVDSRAPSLLALLLHW